MKICTFLFVLFFITSCCNSLKSQQKKLELDLSSMGLKDISNIDLSKYLDITKIDLSNNQLSVFPMDILKLKKLKTLVLSKNNIKILPDSIVELENLEFLSIDHNPISSLPKMKSLERLRSVYILDNENLTNEEVQKMECNLPKNVILIAYLEFTNRGKDCDNEPN